MFIHGPLNSRFSAADRFQTSFFIDKNGITNILLFVSHLNNKLISTMSMGSYHVYLLLGMIIQELPMQGIHSIF